MSKIQLDRELIKELSGSSLGDDIDDWTLVHEEIVGEWRWGNECRMVIRHPEHGYFAYEYRTTSGEDGWNFWEEQPDQVQLRQVRPVEVTLTQYDEV